MKLIVVLVLEYTEGDKCSHAYRKYPELFRWFKDFLGYKETGSVEAVPATAMGKERISGELAKEIGECTQYWAYNYIFTILV